MEIFNFEPIKQNGVAVISWDDCGPCKRIVPFVKQLQERCDRIGYPFVYRSFSTGELRGGILRDFMMHFEINLRGFPSMVLIEEGKVVSIHHDISLLKDYINQIEKNEKGDKEV